MTLVDGGAELTQHATLGRWYAHGEQLLGGACPIGLVADGGYVEPISQRSWSQLLADDECAHGRLAGDPTKPCGCWPTELPGFTLAIAPERELLEPTAVVHAATPDLMSVLTPRKEPLMLTAAPERLALPPGLPAPFGVKLDGTPRKRPGRKPKPVPAPEPDPVRMAIEAAANLEPVALVRPTSVVHLTDSSLLSKIVLDIDAEIARLEAAKARLLEVAT